MYLFILLYDLPVFFYKGEWLRLFILTTLDILLSCFLYFKGDKTCCLYFKGEIDFRFIGFC